MELEYNKAQGYIDVTVNNTIKKALERFPATTMYATPYTISNTYYTGSEPQLENAKDESELLDAKETKEVQERIGILRYVADMVFTHLQVAISKIASNMSKPTKQNLEKPKEYLDTLQLSKLRKWYFTYKN